MHVSAEVAADADNSDGDIEVNSADNEDDDGDDVEV